MKSLFLATIVFVSIIITSCGEPVAPIHEKIVNKMLPFEITEADLFSGNKILTFLSNEDKHLKEANSLFLRGLNSFRNEDDYDSAMIYFKASLLKEPTAQTYYELGNLSMSIKNYDQALLSFNMAEQLNYQPFSKILYNKACLYSLTEDVGQSTQYLEYAIQAGYTNLDHIRKDTDLEKARDSWKFEKAIEKGLRGVSNSENLYWLQFKKQFAHIEHPYDLEDSRTYEELESQNGQIAYDYEKYVSEMRDEMFSREVGKMFYYHSIPYETENYVALIYVIRNDFMPESFPLLYRIATFTHEGKLIDKRVIAGQENMDSPLMKASIKKQEIEMKTFEIEYDNDPDKYGYSDNPVVNETMVNAKTLTISEKGKIIVSSNEDLVSEVTK